MKLSVIIARVGVYLGACWLTVGVLAAGYSRAAGMPLRRSPSTPPFR